MYNYVAFRISRQHYNPALELEGKYPIENGWFMYGQIPDRLNIPDELVLNWQYLGRADSERDALERLKLLREMSLQCGAKYCPIYNNGGYAYSGTC